jgi:hypothetical protein
MRRQLLLGIFTDSVLTPLAAVQAALDGLSFRPKCAMGGHGRRSTFTNI